MTTILRLPSVVQRTGMSRAAIYKAIKAGRFPVPRQLGPQSVGWPDTEIDRWIEGLASRAPQPNRGPKPGHRAAKALAGKQA